MNTASTLPEGRIIRGRYKVVKTLGTGGMGSVYLAEDKKKDGLPVAIKEMHKISDPVERAKDIGQFGKEARFLMNLNHHNLPALYDFFLEDDTPYLVMEYIEGNTLEKILEESPVALEEKKVLNWAIQICEVLDYLHTGTSQPIIFRDLKLSNILLDKNNRIKLIDFGIAREFNPRKYTDTIKMGSVGYAPPEQYAKGGQTDVRTDIYALGVCLHALLTRNEPSETPFAFEEVIKINPEVSPELNDIIKKALEIRPEKRFQSSREMLEEMKRIIPGACIRITPDFIDMGEIVTGEKKSFTAVISNTRKGLLAGRIKEPLPGGINLSFSQFEGNYQELMIEVDSRKFEADKNYSEVINFTSNGGEGNIIISFKTILPGTQLETDASFLDFGSLKYGEETSQIITLYNTGGGLLKGEIKSPQKWLSFSPAKFEGNEIKIKISVEPSRLPEEKAAYEGIINIISNGGDISVNTVVFRPIIEITPPAIYPENIPAKENKKIRLKIKNGGKGYIKGNISCDSPWVNLSSDILRGNNNYVDITIEPKNLKKGKKQKAEIKISSNGGDFTVPVILEPPSFIKKISKIIFIFLIALLFIISNHIRHTEEQKRNFQLISRLSRIKGDIIYFYKADRKGNIYKIRPDGTGKEFIATGLFPLPSPDGKKLLFRTDEKEMEIMEMSSGKILKIIKGTNPVWSPDSKKIAFDREDGIIYIIGREGSEEESLIYGRRPSWNPGGDKLVYDDSKSVKLISLKDKTPEIICNGFSPLWSPDGFHIIYNLDNKTLNIIDIKDLSVKETFEGEKPVWSHDGKKIAYHCKDFLYIFNTDTGENTKIEIGIQPSWSPEDKYIAFRGYENIYIMELSSGMKYSISPSGYYPVWIISYK